MDQELDKRLTAIEERLDENHHLLIKMRRVQRNANLFRLFYWLVIIALTLGAFYYIQPYIKQVTELYSGFQTTQDKIKTTIPDVKYLENLFNQLQGN